MPISGNSQSEEQQLKQLALNYGIAYEQGKVDLMKSILHPSIIKRGVYRKDGKEYPLSDIGYKQLIELVKRNTNRKEEDKNRDLHTKIIIHGIFENIANLTLKDDLYIEYLSLLKVKGKWKIINVLWTNR